VEEISRSGTSFLVASRARRLSASATSPPLAGGKLGARFPRFDRGYPSRISIYITAAARK